MASHSRSASPATLSASVHASHLFDGPTMIKVVAPTKTRSMFNAIYPAVVPGSRQHPLYIECKTYSKSVYEQRYKTERYVADMSLVEPHDKNSVIVFSTDRNHRVAGTLRLCLDAGSGLPLANDLPDVIAGLRRQGLTCAEPGRFTNGLGNRMSRCLISAAYEIARYSGIDVYLMQCRADHCEFYQTHLAAEVLQNYRAPERCVNMIWRIDDTPNEFFDRFGRNRLSLENLLRKSENFNG